MTLAIVLIASLPLMLLRGWVLSLLWGWYVTDTFGIRPLSVVEAVGITILVSLFTIRRDRENNDDEPWGSIIYSILSSLLALGFGWVWTLFL